MLYQLSYSHRHADYTTAIPCCQKGQASPSGDGGCFTRTWEDHSVLGQKPRSHGTQHRHEQGKGSTKQGEGETVEERSKEKNRRVHKVSRAPVVPRDRKPRSDSPAPDTHVFKSHGAHPHRV